MRSITTYSNDAHRAEVVRLWEAVFAYKEVHNQPGVSIDRKLAVNDGLFFVAMDKDRVVGTVLAGYDGHRGWLYSVAVYPSHARQGIGADLVRHAERALFDRGCVKINLQIRGGNESVTGFYEALGYVVEPRVSLGKLAPSVIPK